MWKEFKQFAMRGNVLDLAVGVMIGAAFSKIVSSLVEDVMMPFIGLLIGGIDFTDLKLTFGEAEIMYGKFIQTIADFLIVAFSVFLFVKLVTRLTKRQEKKEAEPAAPSKEEELLAEIRDLLKSKHSLNKSGE
ncbi:large conductance mechanosensitive channel protein MscL [Bacillus xiapuensis]|uniref:large conductance mechanosensitive channel protein MscL n=1 Tax=Bacillus xiapuensis TaxID=2014075 RepID=UPI000C237AA6|nr:large conductance mechanosensitive channel protein MscL [Bacillus xiapuensis]